MSKFYDIEPSLEHYWRLIILFGRNVATYKIALAKALSMCSVKPRRSDTLFKVKGIDVHF